MAHLDYSPLSLTDMAIRRLAAVLFKESNVLASISNFDSKFSPFNDFDSPQAAWRETVEDILQDEISKLGLPNSLTKLLIDTVKPMGQLVGRWKEFHEKYLHHSRGEEIHFDVPILEKLCWTAAGVVDFRKTTEGLIRSDVIDIVNRYILACLYCLEDYIRLFWKELPKENKRYFRSKTGRRLQHGGMGLEFLWPYIIKGQESKLDDLTRSFRRDQQYAFRFSVEKGNKTAAIYFFQKLTHEEREASLMSTTRALVLSPYFPRNDWYKVFPREKFSELLSYLLSVMTPSQQMTIFQEQPCQVLNWFLKWPLQNTFSEIADVIWDFLTARDYNTVLKMMYRRFRNLGDCYLRLFQEFFLRIPRDLRESFVDLQCEFRSYFDEILMEEDIEALEMLFRSVDAAARARIVFSDPALTSFLDYMSIGK